MRPELVRLPQRHEILSADITEKLQLVGILLRNRLVVALKAEPDVRIPAADALCIVNDLCVNLRRHFGRRHVPRPDTHIRDAEYAG